MREDARVSNSYSSRPLGEVRLQADADATPTVRQTHTMTPEEDVGGEGEGEDDGKERPVDPGQGVMGARTDGVTVSGSDTASASAASGVGCSLPLLHICSLNPKRCGYRWSYE